MKRKEIKKVISVLVLTTFLASNAYAHGVCTHMGTDITTQQTLQKVNEINAEWVRDEAQWQGMSRNEDGTYDVGTKANWVTAAKNNGKKVLLLLAYGNTSYSTNVMDLPKKDTQYFTEWISYVRSVVTATKGKVDAFEVWNEPDNAVFNTNGATAQDYYNLLKVTYDVIQEVYSGESTVPVVLGGSTLDTSWKTNTFLRDFLALNPDTGVTKCMDAIAIHAYAYARTTDKNTPEKSFKELLDKSDGEGGYQYEFDLADYNGDVWLTETGWFDGSAANAVSSELQAAYLIRTNVIFDNYLKSIGKNGEYFWYDMINDGDSQANQEYNFGLVKSDYSPKPAYYSAKIFNKLTNGKTFKSLTTSSDANTALYEGEDGSKTYVIWSSAASPTATKRPSVSLSGDIITKYDYQGESNVISAGNIQVPVNGYPTLIECKNHSTSITSINYDADKNLISIEGKSTLQNVNIDVVSASQTVKTVAAKVSNGSFATFFTPGIAGEITVYAGKGTASVYGEETITVSPRSVSPEFIGTPTLSYNVSTKTATLSGTVANPIPNQKITVLATAKDADLSAITKDKIVYSGETSVAVDGAFTLNFAVPRDGNMYNIYIGGNNITKQNAGEAGAAFNINFTNASYDADKNIITVSGSAAGFDNLTLEIIKDNNVIKTENLKVYSDGSFNKFVTASEDGQYSVRVGKTELNALGIDEDYKKDVVVSKTAPQTPVSTMNNDAVVSVLDNAVTVNGTVSTAVEGEKATIIVVPSATDLSNLTAKNIAYIGQTTLSEGAYSYSFNMPENAEGQYKVLLQCEYSQETINKALNNGNASAFANVCDFTINGTDTITVHADINNVNAVQNGATIAIAQYDANGALLDIKCKAVTVDANTVVACGYEHTVEKVSGAAKVYAFVWDSLTGLRPLFGRINLE